MKAATERGGKGVYFIVKAATELGGKRVYFIVAGKRARWQTCWAANKLGGKRVLDKSYDQSYTRVIPELQIHQS